MQDDPECGMISVAGLIELLEDVDDLVLALKLRIWPVGDEAIPEEFIEDAAVGFDERLTCAQPIAGALNRLVMPDLPSELGRIDEVPDEEPAVACLDFEERPLGDGACLLSGARLFIRLSKMKAEGTDGDLAMVSDEAWLLHTSAVQVSDVLAAEVDEVEILPILGVQERVVPGYIRVVQNDIVGGCAADAAAFLDREGEILCACTFQPGEWRVMFRHFITPFYTVISLPQVVCCVKHNHIKTTDQGVKMTGFIINTQVRNGWWGRGRLRVG